MSQPDDDDDNDSKDFCDCICHRQDGVIHCMPCCHDCPVCGNHIKFEAHQAHVATCAATARVAMEMSLMLPVDNRDPCLQAMLVDPRIRAGIAHMLGRVEGEIDNFIAFLTDDPAQRALLSASVREAMADDDLMAEAAEALKQMDDEDEAD